MSTELRDLISEVWEYCQEHTTMAVAVGAVLLILLVSVLLVLSAKREETEADSEVADVIEEVPEPETKDEPEVEAEPEPEETDPLEPSVAAARDVVEDILRSVKAASGVSGQKVEAIELKIEKAQLTIHYAGSSKTGYVNEIMAEEEESVPDAIQELEPETAETEDFAAPKKFGLENMSMARSGRVYTEEELLQQIRD